MTFLKWVGGKSKSIPQIMSKIDDIPNKNSKVYYEPFLGTGIVLQNIIRKYDFAGYVASDINPVLIATHKCIKSRLNELIEQLQRVSKDTSEKHYYNVRDSFNKLINDNKFTPYTCALFIYLNKTCFRGLYRVNGDGDFNTPYGNYKNPRIFDEEQLREISKLYNSSKVEFRCCSYESIDYGRGNVIYLDAPYLDTFDRYSDKPFNENRDEYIDFLKRESHKGNIIILSDTNKITDYIKVYFDTKTIYLQDKINSKHPGTMRAEILADNMKWIARNHKH